MRATWLAVRGNGARGLLESLSASWARDDGAPKDALALTAGSCHLGTATAPTRSSTLKSFAEQVVQG
eukprot:14842586-Alexandrium_andersonii.AAC.1